MQKSKIKIYLIISLVFFGISFFSGISHAADWYVDNAATGTNNGTSWINAWQSFSAIVWGTNGVKAGDTLYISGGITSKIYNETLRIDASGSAIAGYINIKVGQTAPHNGKVIIDKLWTNYYGINISGQSYIDISGQVNFGSDPKIEVTHASFSGISVTGNSHHINLGYLDVNRNGDRDNVAGILYQVVEHPAMGEIHHSKIHDNTILQIWLIGTSGSFNTNYGSLKVHDNEIYNSQEDFIDGNLSGADFYNNIIHDRLTAFTNYSDMIQWWGRYFRWYNNTTYHLARDYNPTQPVAWQPNTQYRFGTLISPTGTNITKRHYGQRASGLCTSGATEPSWNPAFTSHTPDGTCDWESYMAIANDDGTWWPSDWAVNAHVKYSPDGSKDGNPTNVMIFNNVAYETDLPRCYDIGGCTGARAFELSLSDSTLTSVSNVYVMNNTIIGLPLNAITMGFHAGEIVSNIIVENNLLFNNGGLDPRNIAPVAFSPMNGVSIGNHGSGATVICDNNLFYADSSHSNKMALDGVVYSFEQFQTFANAHGIASNPNLTSDYKLESGSPAINSGVSLSSYFSTDKDGISRPQGLTWDIGAYEYISGGTPTPTPTPVPDTTPPSPPTGIIVN